MSVRRRLATCLAAGILTALSVAPFGWWVLGPVGLAVLAHQLRDLPWRRRAALGVAFSLGLYGVGLAWAVEFTLPGTFVFIAIVTVQTGVPVALVPPARGRLLAFPAVLVAIELWRSAWPFGGLPLSGIDLGQTGGPLAPVVALGGRFLLVGVTAALAAALAAAWVRRPRAAIALAGAGVALAVVAALAPAGRTVGTLRVAVVQGGGPRGIPADEADERAVFRAHVEASTLVRGPVDLVLWPEDVIDVDRFEGSPEEAEVAAIARRLAATVVVGVVDDAPGGRFTNAAVAFGPDGRRVDRYDKVHAVPFGEYFPFRSFLENFAAVPSRDMRRGPDVPGVLDTPAGRVGVVISYEVFFEGRARAAIRAGGEVLLVPTNASSYTTGQMPAQEVAAARLRARQTGRATLQAAPTGFSAVLDHHGRVRSHTDLGAPGVLRATVERRRGQTPYGRTGDWPTVGASAAVLAGAWYLSQRRSGSMLDSPTDHL